MPNPIDLTGPITEAVNGAAERGHPVVIAYVDDSGYPATSFRGSAQVYSPTQLAVWARKPDEGLARCVARRPEVTLLYYGPGTATKFLSFRGRARVDPDARDAVYGNMVELERKADPDRAGVAVVIDVEQVIGRGANGQINQRSASSSSAGYPRPENSM